MLELDNIDPVEILEWIDRNAEAYAKAQTSYRIAQEQLKVAKATAYSETSGTVAERDAASISSESYRTSLEALEKAEYLKHLSSIKLEQKKMLFEYWRTMSANKRQGI